MRYTSRRKVDECILEKRIVNGRRTFKCKNLRRLPTAQEIIENLKN